MRAALLALLAACAPDEALVERPEPPEPEQPLDVIGEALRERGGPAPLYPLCDDTSHLHPTYACTGDEDACTPDDTIMASWSRIDGDEFVLTVLTRVPIGVNPGSAIQAFFWRGNDRDPAVPQSFLWYWDEAYTHEWVDYDGGTPGPPPLYPPETDPYDRPYLKGDPMLWIGSSYVPEVRLEGLMAVPHWPLRATRACTGPEFEDPPAAMFETRLLAGGFVVETRFPLSAVTSAAFLNPSYQLVAVNIDPESHWPLISPSSLPSARWQVSPPTPGTFLSSRGGAPGPIEGIPPLTDEIAPYCRVQYDPGVSRWTPCSVDGRGIWE